MIANNPPLWQTLLGFAPPANKTSTPVKPTAIPAAAAALKTKTPPATGRVGTALKLAVPTPRAAAAITPGTKAAPAPAPVAPAPASQEPGFIRKHPILTALVGAGATYGLYCLYKARHPDFSPTSVGSWNIYSEQFGKWCGATLKGHYKTTNGPYAGEDLSRLQSGQCILPQGNKGPDSWLADYMAEQYTPHPDCLLARLSSAKCSYPKTGHFHDADYDHSKYPSLSLEEKLRVWYSPEEIAASKKEMAEQKQRAWNDPSFDRSCPPERVQMTMFWYSPETAKYLGLKVRRGVIYDCR